MSFFRSETKSPNRYRGGFKTMCGVLAIARSFSSVTCVQFLDLSDMRRARKRTT